MYIKKIASGILISIVLITAEAAEFIEAELGNLQSSTGKYMTQCVPMETDLPGILETLESGISVEDWQKKA